MLEWINSFVNYYYSINKVPILSRLRERSNGLVRERKQRGRAHWWRGKCWKCREGGREVIFELRRRRIGTTGRVKSSAENRGTRLLLFLLAKHLGALTFVLDRSIRADHICIFPRDDPFRD